MQKVAAYLLERRDGMEDPAVRLIEADRVRETILGWVESKGAPPQAISGSFEPVDGGQGTFVIESAQDGARVWWMARLAERASTGRCFTTSISVTTTESSVAVYVSLEAGADTTQISPLYVDPRCPHIVRSLLALGGNWYHGASRLEGVQRVASFEAGERLAGQIGNPERTMPVVVVSEDYTGRLPLPEIDTKLTYDLAGLANVYRLDSDATWALTDSLGREFTCFNGAVRVYWPGWTTNDHPRFHPRWTVERLRLLGDDDYQTLERFRRRLRNMLMRAAALSVVRPLEIDEIRGGEARRVFAEMRTKAASLEDYQTLADLYAKDNDSLRATVQAQEEAIKELETAIANLECRLQFADRSSQDVGAASDNLEPDPEPEAEQVPPERGEVRFYKKLYSAPTHDILTIVQDCGCNRWENASRAEKAKKGVVKLEGRNDWQTMQHCAKCTGGGMWKVRW